MAQNHEAYLPLQQRVDQFLRGINPVGNSPSAPTRRVDTKEAELNEYLLRRAERELREVQARIDELRRKLGKLPAPVTAD